MLLKKKEDKHKTVYRIHRVSPDFDKYITVEGILPGPKEKAGLGPPWNFNPKRG